MNTIAQGSKSAEKTWDKDPVTGRRLANWQTLNAYTQRLRQALYGIGYLKDPDFSLSQDPDAIEKVMRDPIINFAVNFRKRLVAGREWYLEAEDDKYKDMVPIFTDVLSKIERFTQSRFILGEAVFQGVAIGRLDGYMDYCKLKSTDRWNKWWYPRRIAPVDKRRLRREYVRYMDDNGKMTFKYIWTIFDVEEAQWFAIDKPDWYMWFVYNDEEDRLGYGKGLYDALYLPWLLRTNVMQYGASWLERFAEPWIIAELDAEVGDTDQFSERASNYINLLKQMRGGRTLVFDKRDKLSLAEAGTGAQSILQEFIKLINEDIIRICLSNTLTTGTGQHGSRAQAEVHEDSQESAVNYDRMLFQEEHDRYLMSPVWRYNRVNLFQMGHMDVPWKCPLRFKLQQEQKWDPKEQLEVFRMAKELKVPTKVEEFRERMGLSKPAMDDEIIDLSAPAASGSPFGFQSRTEKWLAGR